MNKKQAQLAWGTIHDELEERFLKRRPKMKSFEVHHSLEVARKAVAGLYKTADFAALRKAAFKACGEV